EFEVVDELLERHTECARHGLGEQLGGGCWTGESTDPEHGVEPEGFHEVGDKCPRDWIVAPRERSCRTFEYGSNVTRRGRLAMGRVVHREALAEQARAGEALKIGEMHDLVLVRHGVRE